MFKEYYTLYEKCKKLSNPTYEQIKDIKNKWDKLTLIFLKNINAEDMTDLYTRLDESLIENYWNEFVSLLNYYCDRMNLNRWCRLHLLLTNAEGKAYSTRGDKDANS